jgi:hypothetical protein
MMKIKVWSRKDENGFFEVEKSKIKVWSRKDENKSLK